MNGEKSKLNYKSVNLSKLKEFHVKDKKRANIVLLLISCLSLGFFGGWLGSESRLQNSAELEPSVSRQVVLNESELVNQLVNDVGPSVVSVNVVGTSRQLNFFGFSQEFQQQSAGTGFIISEDGVIITNRHVVPPGTTGVSVTLSDGTELDDVEIIGRTSESDSLDVAFLKINNREGKDLTPAKIGDSAEVKVGDRVVAIGNALGQFQNTVTTGIISGYGRTIEAGGRGGNVETLQNLFQTDAAINQGNSGGPLVNINGEVIGINTAVAGGGAENIGFSIPINDIKGLISSVLEQGILLRPYLGIRYVTLTSDYAYQYDLNSDQGAYIVPGSDGQPSVFPDSPASKAGLQEGDIITKVGDDTVDESNSLTSLLGKHKVGELITLTVLRGDSELQIPLTLEAAPED